MESLDAYSVVEACKVARVYASELSEPVDVRISRGEDNTVFSGYRSACSRLKVSFFGSGNVVFIGAGARVAGDFQIKGDNITIFIGAFTTISNLTLTQWGSDSTFFIGERCMISSKIIAGNTDSHGIYSLSTGKRVNGNRDIRIEDDVWIAREVLISKGVHIGSHTVVGQGSLLAGKLEKNSVYAGVPAKQLMTDTTWSRDAADSLEELKDSPNHRGHQRMIDGIVARVQGANAGKPVEDVVDDFQVILE